MERDLKSSKKLSRRGFLGLAATGSLAGAAIWQWEEVNKLTVERKALRLSRWKADGFKVAQLSDLHANHRAEGERAARALRMAIRERPDAIVLTGDYNDVVTPEAIPSLEIALSAASEAKCPVYAVLGNHDYWVDSTAELIKAIERHGIRLLRNEIVEQDGVAIWGIDDGLERKDRHDTLRGKQDTGSVLALFHEPDFVSRVNRRIGLMLAGHSHGGQICLPFGIPIHTPGGARRYKSGFYPGARVPLYVNRGIGTVGPRKRAFCPPEVSILTLRGA
jgi:predicted MPP superfamily phosphohydrolase